MYYTVCAFLFLLSGFIFHWGIITFSYASVTCLYWLKATKAVCRFVLDLDEGRVKEIPLTLSFKETGEVLWVSKICRTDISHFLFCLPVCVSPWRSCSILLSHLSDLLLSVCLGLPLSFLSVPLLMKRWGWPWTQSVLQCQECAQHNALSFLSW